MNMKVYCIVDWDSRYEVSDKGSEYRPGDRKKANLKYVRLAVHGKSEGVGWKRLRRAVGNENVLTAFGLFSKLLELAADQEREFRGYLLDEQQQPALAEYMEMLWGIPQDIISQYLPKLVEIGWIAETDFQGISGDFGRIPETSGKSGKIPETSENFGKIPESSEFTPPNETETEHNITITKTETVSENFGKEKIQDSSASDSAKEIKTKSGFVLKVADVEQFGIGNSFQDASELTNRHLPMPSVGSSGFRQQADESDGLITKQACIDTGQLAGLTKEIKTKSAFVLKVADVLVFKPNSSDHTAILNLADYLDQLRNKTPRVFEEVIEVARSKISSTTIRNPIAAFFADVKKRYGFN